MTTGSFVVHPNSGIATEAEGMMTEKSWNIGGAGGPAGPFYSVVKPDGQIVAMQILTQEMAELIAGIPQLQAEVERLKSELSQAAGLAMALMAHVPDNLLVGDVRPRALIFCREWGELQGHVDGVRAAVLAEREACAAICDARSRMHNASGIVHTHSDQVRYLEARRIAELIRERS